jgi:DNA-binding NarL/FixJ family response regulator
VADILQSLSAEDQSRSAGMTWYFAASSEGRREAGVVWREGAGRMKAETGLPVLIVDDHAKVRQGIRWILEGYEDIQVVGEASTGGEAINMVKQLCPRVVLMDINMPHMNGIEATAHITRRYPDTIIIGLSVAATTQNEKSMIQAGAVQLIPKENAADLLYDAVQQALKSRKMSG